MDTLPINSNRRGVSQDLGAVIGVPGGSLSLPASLGTRFSVASHVSVSSYFTEDFGRLEVLDDEDLKQLVDDLREANNILELENELMVRYLIRNAEYEETSLRQMLDRVSERAWRIIRMGPTSGAAGRQSTSSSNIALNVGRSLSRATLDSSGDRRKSTTSGVGYKDPSSGKLTSPTMSPARRISQTPSMVSAGGAAIPRDFTGQKLNLAGKLEMMSRELADGKRELDRLEAFFEHRSVVLRVRIESANTMADELNRERDAFEKDVAVGGVDVMTGRVPAERFVRHVAEWIRNMAQLGEKLRLRTSTLFSQLRRVQAQLAAKAELGETLTPVDFEQLHIDNKRFLATIEQKNLQVIELKRMAGDCALQLSVHKKALLADRAIEDFLRSIGDERQRQCDLMEEERQAVEDQIERLQNRLESLNTLTANFTAPSVYEYAQLRAKVAEQQHQHRIWKRRVDLQESALRVATSNMRSSTRAARRAENRLSQADEEDAQKFCDFWFGMAAEEDIQKEEEMEEKPDSEDSWIDMPDHFVPLSMKGKLPCADIERELEELRTLGAAGPGKAAAPRKLRPLIEIPGEYPGEGGWYQYPGFPFHPNVMQESRREWPSDDWGVATEWHRQTEWGAGGEEEEEEEEGGVVVDEVDRIPAAPTTSLEQAAVDADAGAPVVVADEGAALPGSPPPGETAVEGEEDEEEEHMDQQGGGDEEEEEDEGMEGEEEEDEGMEGEEEEDEGMEGEEEEDEGMEGEEEEEGDDAAAEAEGDEMDAGEEMQGEDQ